MNSLSCFPAELRGLIEDAEYSDEDDDMAAGHHGAAFSPVTRDCCEVLGTPRAVVYYDVNY